MTTTSRSSKRGAPQDELSQLVSRRDLGDALNGDDRDHRFSGAVSTGRSRPARLLARFAASVGPDMTAGATTQRMPSASTSGASSESASSTTSVAANGAQRRATPDYRDLMAEVCEHPVRRPLQRLACDDRGNGHGIVAPAGHGVGNPGHGQHRPDRHDRVRGADHDYLGRLDRLDYPGCWLGKLDAVETDVFHVDAVAEPDKELLEPDLHQSGLSGPGDARPAARRTQATERSHVIAQFDRDPGFHRAVGHRQQPGCHAKTMCHLSRHLGQSGSGCEAPGPEQVGRQVAVAQVEPGEAGSAGPARLVERLQGSHDRPGLTRKAPAGLVVRRPGEGVGHRVDVGAHVQPVQHQVVAGVDDGGDRCLADDSRQAPQHARSSDPAGEGGDSRARCVQRRSAAWGRRATFSSARLGFAWSRAERTGAFTPQSAPMSGSSHATPSSSAGL